MRLTRYIDHVTPTEFAEIELALWEQALREQQDAEQRLERARHKGPRERVFALMSEVEALRTRADLLLAEAVRVKCLLRDGGAESDEFTSTRLGLMDGEGNE